MPNLLHPVLVVIAFLPTAPVPQPAAAARTASSPVLEQIASLTIPALGVTVAVTAGTTPQSMDAGAGHWTGSAPPGGRGNVVIAGHRTSHRRPFRHLDRLRPGNLITLRSGGRLFAYVVTGHEIVSDTAVGHVTRQTTEATLTLFTCHPVGSTRERYVVRAVLLRPPTLAAFP